MYYAWYGLYSGNFLLVYYNASTVKRASLFSEVFMLTKTLVCDCLPSETLLTYSTQLLVLTLQ